MDKTNLALRYLNRGWSVIAVGDNKIPLVPWRDFQKRRASADEVVEWFNLFPKAQIGIVTGKISNLTVIDMEKDAKFETVSENTYTVKTGGGGRHFYFTYDADFKNAVRTMPLTDIRSEGGYVVAAGSRSLKGEYEVVSDVPIVTMSEATKKFFLPPEFKKEPTRRKKLQDLVARPPGDRNGSLASIIGKMLRTTPEAKWDLEVYSAALEINETYQPPLKKNEVITIYESICRSEERRLRDVQANKGTLTEEEIAELCKKNLTEGTYALAKLLVKKYQIVSMGDKERSDIYTYEKGKYTKTDQSVIYPEVQRILGSLTTKRAKTETLHKIVDSTQGSFSVFETAPIELIPVKNGVYNVLTKELWSHSHTHRFLFCFPFEYLPEAKCPVVLDFLSQVLHPKSLPVFQEIVGYLFYRRYSFKKAIILIGEKDTGKTTLISLLVRLLGKENISGVSLQKIGTDKFAAASLFAKHANFVDDLSAGDVTQTGNFKMVTGGGTISGEYKFGSQFNFENYAKLLFACNKIPELKDNDDDAYYNRWLILRFDNHIEKKVVNLIDTLSTPEELSGLFNWSMEGLGRLLKDGEFSDKRTDQEIKKEMWVNSSSIANFVSVKCYKEMDHEISKDELYNAYSKYCSEEDLPMVVKETFGRRFSNYCSYASDGQRGGYSGVKHERVWRGVNIKSEDIDKELEKF